MRRVPLLYRIIYFASVGLGGASCAGKGSSPGVSPSAERTISAGGSYTKRAVSACKFDLGGKTNLSTLLPVGWDGLLDFVTISAHKDSGA